MVILHGIHISMSKTQFTLIAQVPNQAIQTNFKGICVGGWLGRLTVVFKPQIVLTHWSEEENKELEC